MSQHNAIRAAGQAVAALAHGVPITHVDIYGAAIRWPEVREMRPRSEVLAGLAVGLAGIAAESRDLWGGPITSSNLVVSWRFTPSQLDDFAIARELAHAVDPTDRDDVLFRIWNQALDFVADELVWRAIERIAAAIVRSDADGCELLETAAHYLDREQGAPGLVPGPHEVVRWKLERAEVIYDGKGGRLRKASEAY